jgi:hypothetical protein
VDRRDEAALWRRKQAEKFKMTVKKFELKAFTREQWLAMDSRALKDQFERLEKEYPLVIQTDAGRTFSMVRRMQVEKRLGIPVHLRSGFAISVETGKAADEMTDDEWEAFYATLVDRLSSEYPDLYRRLFPN